MSNKIGWKWSTFKSNVKKQPFFIIGAVALLIVLSISSVRDEIKDRKHQENVKAYEEAYINNEHPHEHPHEQVQTIPP